jgi:hypothetical protein
MRIVDENPDTGQLLLGWFVSTRAHLRFTGRIHCHPTGRNCKPSSPTGGGIFVRQNAGFSTGVDTFSKSGIQSVITGTGISRISTLLFGRVIVIPMGPFALGTQVHSAPSISVLRVRPESMDRSVRWPKSTKTISTGRVVNRAKRSVSLIPVILGIRVSVITTFGFDSDCRMGSQAARPFSGFVATRNVN